MNYKVGDRFRTTGTSNHFGSIVEIKHGQYIFHWDDDNEYKNYIYNRKDLSYFELITKRQFVKDNPLILWLRSRNAI